MTRRNELDKKKRSHKRSLANIRKRPARRGMIPESIVLLVDFAIEKDLGLGFIWGWRESFQSSSMGENMWTEELFNLVVNA